MRVIFCFVTVWFCNSHANVKLHLILIVMNFCYLFSDWNGSKRGHVYKFLRSQGFVSSYDTAHQYTDAEAHKVSNILLIIISNHFISLSIGSYDRILHMFLIYLSSMQWVSHRNHRGNICGVDFIWLLNPNRYRKVLKISWSETVFGMFKVSSSISFFVFSTFHLWCAVLLMMLTCYF